MPNPCEALHQKAIDLNNKIQKIHSSPGYIQGKNDPHPGKPDPEMLAQVKALYQKLAAASAQYDTCMLALGGKPDTLVIFKGNAVLITSDSHAKGPFTQGVSIHLLFYKYDHKHFDVIGFPPIVVGPFPVPGGTNTTTISLQAGSSGLFDPATGIMKLTLPLHFHESNIWAGDSDITFLLSTENPKGSRLDNAGHVAISASATFQSGFLGGDTGTLTVTGLLSPHP